MAEPPEPTPATRSEATVWLSAARGGDPRASERVLGLVYEEMRRMAAGLLRRERADHTLQPTALVHEAWMKLFDQQQAQWEGRAHFLSVAALAMRRLLVDHARGRARQKRGEGREREPLTESIRDAFQLDLDILALDEGLQALARESERAAKLVELRFFAGLSEDEIAQVLEVSRATVQRDWRAARAWLSHWMKPEEPREPE